MQIITDLKVDLSFGSTFFKLAKIIIFSERIARLRIKKGKYLIFLHLSNDAYLEQKNRKM